MPLADPYGTLADPYGTMDDMIKPFQTKELTRNVISVDVT
jgi:hypothetical protein